MTEREANGAGAATVLEVRGISKDYGDGVLRLRDVSFDLEEGEILGFLGPNGAGKTTTIRILATLLEPTAGDALICGHSVSAEPEAVRGCIGYVPDRPVLYDDLTVREHLEFYAAAYGLRGGKSRAVVDDVIALTDLHQLADRCPAALSAGMRQRLALGRCLLHDPKVLLLDEPSAQLDPRARIEFRALIRELASMRKAVLISSHVLAELTGFVTSVAVLEKGNLVACGPVSELLSRMGRKRRGVIQFVRECPEALRILGGLSGVTDVTSEGSRVSFTYAGPLERFHAVLRALVEPGLPVVRVEWMDGDLEGLFLDLTEGELG